MNQAARILISAFIGLLAGGSLGLWYADTNIPVSNYGAGIVFVFVVFVGSVLGLTVGCIAGAIWARRPRND